MNKKPAAFNISTFNISVTLAGGYFLILLACMLYTAYQFAQTYAYYFSLCLLAVALVSFAHGLYRSFKLHFRLPASMLVPANSPIQIPCNSNRPVAGALISFNGKQRFPLQNSNRDNRYHIMLPGQARGVYDIDRLYVTHTCALGIFQFHKPYAGHCQILVYPEPLPELDHAPGAEQDNYDLYPYRNGDALHRIDWRGAARGRELHCYRRPDQIQQDDIVTLSGEQPLQLELGRISAALIARSQGLGNFGLQLGEQTLAPGQGAAHLSRCLESLARYAAKPNAQLQGKSQQPVSEPSQPDKPAAKLLLLLCGLSSVSAYMLDSLYLPLVFCVFALAWRVTKGPLQNTLRNQVWLSLIIVFGAAFQCFLLSSVFSFQTAVAYLTLAVASKLLFSDWRKDALIIISLFCLLSFMGFYNNDHPLQLVLSISSMISGVVFVLFVIGLTRHWAQVSAMLLPAIMLSSLVYASFPPPQNALWQLPLGDGEHAVGLGSEVTPGSMSGLSRSQRVAFRAYMDSFMQSNANWQHSKAFYWRASVYEYFDGTTWQHGSKQTYHLAQAETEQTNSAYRVQLSQHLDNRLISLDLPGYTPSLNIDYLKNSQNELFQTNIAELHDYRVRPYREALKPLSVEQRKQYLQLPAATGEKIRVVTASWRAQVGEGHAQQLIAKALAFFARGNFVYSTENIQIEGDIIDGFLFGQRRGYCEHYASAFSFMMRALGIPARVVTGYHGAEYHGNGNYFVVRDAMAHAWAEVWLPEQGWVRVDPTGYVQDEASLTSALSNWLQQRLDRLANPLWWVLVPGVILLLLGLRIPAKRLLLLLPSKRPLAERMDVAAQACFTRLRKRCLRHGLVLLDSEDMDSCTGKIAQQYPALLPQAKEINHLYNNLRYSPSKNLEQLQRLKKLVRQVKL